jgi:hypothetical protein
LEAEKGFALFSPFLDALIRPAPRAEKGFARLITSPGFAAAGYLNMAYLIVFKLFYKSIELLFCFKTD